MINICNINIRLCGDYTIQDPVNEFYYIKDNTIEQVY